MSILRKKTNQGDNIEEKDSVVATDQKGLQRMRIFVVNNFNYKLKMSFTNSCTQRLSGSAIGQYLWSILFVEYLSAWICLHGRSVVVQ